MPNVEPFEFYVNAFSELSSCRGQNNAIQFTAIVEYYNIYEVGDFEEFLYIIRVMDNTLLGLEDGNRDKKNKS